MASEVHIVEPQWNPSVEEQAIARAVRIGQARIVTLYRYWIKDTVEEVHSSNALSPTGDMLTWF
jgi:SNF2 family DNA or RNA helicase